MSILSHLPDGMGYYYGFLPGSTERIDVKRDYSAGRWIAYVGGERLSQMFPSKEAAERAAVAKATASMGVQHD